MTTPEKSDQCQCEGPGYCRLLGRHMTGSRHNECKNNREFFRVFLKESQAGKYAHSQYQNPYSTNDPVNISLPYSRIARNAASSASDFAQSPTLLEASETEKRVKVCDACEFKRGNKCKACGCNLKLKQRAKAFHCPFAKWDGDAEHYRSGPVSRWAVGVTTAIRDKPTLNDTLDSIHAAGWQDITVFSEPGVEPQRSHRLAWITNETKLGAWQNFRNGLSNLIARNPDADAYLMFQDDVKVAKHTRQFLEECLWLGDGDKVGVVSLYTYRNNHRDEVGWEQVSRAWGALAYVFTPLSARLLVSATNMSVAAVDSRVKNWCRDAGLKYFCHSPSLAQHTGETSTIHAIGMNANRQAKVWCEDASVLIGGDISEITLLEST